MGGTGHARGHRWEKFAAFVIQSYAGICHICGHPGARQVDHLVPVTEGGEEWRLENCRPAHGAPGNPCRECSLQAGRNIFCNQLRSAMSVDRARRLIERKIAENQNPPGTGNARPPGRPKPAPDAGRPW